MLSSVWFEVHLITVDSPTWWVVGVGAGRFLATGSQQPHAYKPLHPATVDGLNRRTVMALYMVQFAYTQEAWTAFTKQKAAGMTYKGPKK